MKTDLPQHDARGLVGSVDGVGRLDHHAPDRLYTWPKEKSEESVCEHLYAYMADNEKKKPSWCQRPHESSPLPPLAPRHQNPSWPLPSSLPPPLPLRLRLQAHIQTTHSHAPQTHAHIGTYTCIPRHQNLSWPLPSSLAPWRSPHWRFDSAPAPRRSLPLLSLVCW